MSDVDNLVDVALVDLRLGFLAVLGVYIRNRTAAEDLRRQHHDSDEPARTVVGRLSEYRIGAALEPGCSRPIAGRMAQGINSDPAIDEAADAGTLVLVQI